MIQIKVPKLNKIAEKHLLRLVVKKGQEENVIDRLDMRISDSTIPTEDILFYKRLKRDIEAKKQNLITGSPKELEEKIRLYENRYKVSLAKKKFKEDLLNVFYYDKYNKWDAYELAKELKVNVCPYCNRQYTFTIGKSEKKGTRPQFDHFLDKALFPYLALSFYNLIPSCSICNSSLKGSRKFRLNTHLHPYVEGFNERIKFSVRPKNVSFVNGVPSAFRIRYRTNKNKNLTAFEIKKIIRNSTVFRLTALYNQHKDFVAEIIQKSIAYPADYYDTLFASFGGSLFKSVDEVKRMVLSNYLAEDELGMRVLSKLTKDIAEELGII